MVFGLFRSNSDPKRRTAQRQTRAPRPVSTYTRSGNTRDAIHAWNRATDIHEWEKELIMKDERERHGKNDRECKRQMAAIDKRIRIDTERYHREFDMLYRTEVAKYRAEKIDHRELEKKRSKHRKNLDARLAGLEKYRHAEQGKAQRIFFSRGEEISAMCGASLRQSREKMEHGQRLLRV